MSNNQGPDAEREQGNDLTPPQPEAQQTNENAHLLVNDDESQREARATLKAISAAMTERNKLPLIRRDGLVQPETVMHPHDPEDSTIEDLKKFRPQPIPFGALSQNNFVQEEEVELQPQPQPEPELEPEKPPEEADVAQAPPPPKRKSIVLDKKTIGVIVACSLISGVIGITFGINIQNKVVSSLDNAPDANFGHGKAVPRPAGGEDFVGDVVASVMPTVVSVDTAPPEAVEAFKRSETMEPGIDHRSTLAAKKRSLGTGIIVRSDGYIVTSAHVVRAQKDLFVTLTDGRSKGASIVGKDPFTDLALLKIDLGNLPVVRFAPSKSVRPRDWAIAIGTPFGFDHSVSLGVVSALGRSIADLNNHVDLLQTDAAMNPGNSGGPLLNSRGEVIGINTVVRSNAQNIGFAVPVDVVRNVSNQLLAHGDIKRPFIGIFMEDMNTALTSRYGIDHGVVILKVVPGSPAGKAGVGAGDVIIKLNDTAVQTSKDARAHLQRMKPGDVLDFTFFRKGTGQEHRKVRVGDYPYE